MTDAATTLSLADPSFAAGLVPPRAIRHAEARDFVERDDALRELPRALREVLEGAPATAKGIKSDRRLSADGVAEALEQAGRDAARSIASAVKPLANTHAGRIDRALARQPESGAALSRKEAMTALNVGTGSGAMNFAAAEVLAVIERLRDEMREMDGGALRGLLERAATSGDPLPMWALDGLPQILREQLLRRALLADDAWAQLRGRFRASRDPQAAAEAATLRAVGLWLAGNATNARNAIERGALSISPAASAAVDAALEDLVEQLARLGG